MQNSHLYSKNLQHLLSTTIWKIKVHYRGNSDFCEWRAVHAHARKLYTHTHLRTIYAITISASASFKSQKNTVLSWCTIMPQPQQHRCYILLLKQATTSTASIAQPSCYSPSLQPLSPTTVEVESRCCCCCLHLRISTLRLMYEHIYNHTTAMYVCRCVKIWSSSCELHTKPCVFLHLQIYWGDWILED